MGVYLLVPLDVAGGWPRPISLIPFLIPYLLISGVAQLSWALAMSDLARTLLLITGTTSIFLVVPAVAIRWFTKLDSDVAMPVAFLFGLGFILRGVAEVVTAVRGQLLPGRDWHVVLAAITISAGLVVLVLSGWGSANLAFVTSSCLVILGAFDIVFSNVIRRAARAARNTV